MSVSTSRREALAAMASAMFVGPLVRAQDGSPPAATASTASAGQAPDPLLARLEAFYHESGARPQFVWVNREDVMYHDLDYPGPIGEAPEYCCFLRKAWVFNRAMQWVREDGTILCYEAAGRLPLTGEKQVSAWFTGRDQKVVPTDEWTEFTKHSPRYRDCLVLPALQFHVGQHPRLEIEVAEANTDWQFVVSVKGRGGPPLIATPWHSGPARAEIDLAGELRQHGFDWNFPELHFAIGTWNRERDHVSRLKFRAALLSQPAIVPCLPVVRTAAAAAAHGVPLLAVVVDSNGRRLGKDKVRVFADLAGTEYPLAEQDGLWKARLKDVPLGDHAVRLRCAGAARASAVADVRITDGRFYQLEKGQQWLSRAGEPLGPLTGSFQGTLFFRDAGGPREKLVQTQAAWDAWDRSPPEAEHMHYWEAWKTAELDERFRRLYDCGWDLVALHSCWGQWERLDAGGRIAPHAAEQLARYLRIAAKHGLADLQGLSSGPYGHPDQRPHYGGTVPYSRYLDEEFQTKHFMEPGSNARFEELFHQYLEDFATLFRDETGLFGMTASGEGDFFIGAARCNDAMQHLRKFDRNHFIPAEAILMLDRLPSKKTAGYQQQLFGARTYSIGGSTPPEDDLGLEFKLYRMAGLYMAEGCWPPMPAYGRFQHEVLKTPYQFDWTGTEFYRRRVRDTLYLGMVNLVPIMNTWDEQFAEDEHRMIRDIRDQVDWRTVFATPRVALLVDDAVCKGNSPQRTEAARYERFFARLGLMYRTVPADEQRPTDVELVIDARKPFAAPRFASEGGTLPEPLRRQMPLRIRGDYAANHVWSEDRRTLLAYVYNVAGEPTQRAARLGGRLHRNPRPAPVELRLMNLPAGKLRLRVYDLNQRRLRLQTEATADADHDLGASDHDYFVLVTPDA